VGGRTGSKESACCRPETTGFRAGLPRAEPALVAVSQVQRRQTIATA
jgi:hypothetical protein